MSRNRPENPRRRVRSRVERESPRPERQIQQGECWKPVPGLPYDVSTTGQVRSYHRRGGIAKEPQRLLHPRVHPETGQDIVTLCDGNGNEVTMAVDYLYELIFEAPKGVAEVELRPQPRLTGSRAEIARISLDLQNIYSHARFRFRTQSLSPYYARDVLRLARRVEAAARDIATLMEERLGFTGDTSRD